LICDIDSEVSDSLVGDPTLLRQIFQRQRRRSQAILP
jgi:hypothetical protein